MTEIKDLTDEQKAELNALYKKIMDTLDETKTVFTDQVKTEMLEEIDRVYNKLGIKKE